MDGKVAIVTGGAMGIGRAYVEVLLARKIKVCIADINAGRSQQTIDEFKKKFGKCDIIFEECNVTVEEQLKSAFQRTHERFGRLDVVVNNAGIFNESNPDLMIDINMKAVLKGTMIGLKLMSTKEGGQGGVIVNTASETGLFRGVHAPVYSATKHAVVGFTRAIGATSLLEHGVRVNCICPSTAMTEMVTSATPSSFYIDMEIVEKIFGNMKILDPKTVGQCLIPLLDGATVTGAAILCCPGHPYAELKLPETLDDAIEMFGDSSLITTAL